MDVIKIVLVGEGINEADLEFLLGPVGEAFGADVSFSDRFPMPARARDEERGQYLSDMILDSLKSKVRVPRNGRVLAITNEDLYTPGLNFVFGQADTHTGIAIISLARLRPERYGQPSNEEMFRSRAITEAVHEIGHTLGLGHCPDPRCVMHFSNRLADTDIKGHRFCSRCSRILGIRAGG